MRYPDLDNTLFSEIYGDDLEYARDMFALFLDNIHIDYQLFIQAHAAKDWLEMARLAHKMKPNFRMVCLAEMDQLLWNLEVMVKQAVDETLLQSVFFEIQQQYTPSLKIVKTTYQILETQVND